MRPVRLPASSLRSSHASVWRISWLTKTDDTMATESVDLSVMSNLSLE